MWEVTEAHWDPVRGGCTNLDCVRKSGTGVLWPRLEYVAYSEPAGGQSGRVSSFVRSFVESGETLVCPVPGAIIPTHEYH